jgi:general secretion pathway protein M
VKIDLAPARDAWSTRTPRERVLLSALAAVLVGLVGWYGLVAPLGRAAEDAEADRLAAAERLARVEAAAAEIRALSQARDPSAAEVEALVVQSAGEAGLTLDRRRTEADGVTVWLDAAPPAQLFTWLQGLQARQVRVAAFTAIRGAGGTVEAEVRLAGG